jgi:hypothetical protein
MKIAPAVIVVAALCAFGASEQDKEIWNLVPLTQPKYSSCYGSAAEWQTTRAVAERANQFAEHPAQTVYRSHGDLRNLPVLPPGGTTTLYRTWWAMRGHAPFHPHDEIARSSGPSGNYDKLKTMYESWQGVHVVVAPTCAVLCAANDAIRRSYSLPPFGVVVFSMDAIAEEYAHFFNWSPPGEASTGFSAGPLNAVTSWGEFKAAFRGLKLDAWRLGYDVGEQGGMDAYVMDLTGEAPRVSTNWYSVATNIVEIEEVDGIMVTNVIDSVSVAEVVTYNDLLTFTNRVPANSVKLLDAYIEARESEGTQSDNADKAKVRLWMRSDKVGRMIL